MKMNDEIIKEVRRHRMEILESFGWDVEKMMRSMMANQGRKGHPVVTLPKKEPQKGAAPNAYPLRGQA
jgi:hypothetical protein